MRKMSKPSILVAQTPEGYKHWIQNLLKTKEITKEDIKLLLEDYRYKLAILTRPKIKYRYDRP